MGQPGYVPTTRAAFSTTYRLNVHQSIAWHSRDELEREHVRGEIRAAALAQRMHGQTSMPIFDLGGALLERVG